MGCPAFSGGAPMHKIPHQGFRCQLWGGLQVVLTLSNATFLSFLARHSVASRKHLCPEQPPGGCRPLDPLPVFSRARRARLRGHGGQPSILLSFIGEALHGRRCAVQCLRRMYALVEAVRDFGGLSLADAISRANHRPSYGHTRCSTKAAGMFWCRRKHPSLH